MPGFIISIAVWCACVTSALAQIPDASAILSHVRATFAGLDDYTVEMHAELDMPNVQIPPMDVIVYFKQPDKLHVKSEGFAMIPKQGVLLNPNAWQDSLFYTAVMEPDTVDGERK